MLFPTSKGLMQNSQSVSMDVKTGNRMDRFYGIVLPILGIWLVGWMVLAWSGIQDDALIHLRYAENLLRTHRISYDGVHANYGTSSLLYVYLLAFFCLFTQSPNLPKVLSCCVHLALVLGMSLVFVKFVPLKGRL